MSTDKAVEVLEFIRRDKKYASDPVTQRAFEMALKALREQKNI